MKFLVALAVFLSVVLAVIFVGVDARSLKTAQHADAFLNSNKHPMADLKNSKRASTEYGRNFRNAADFKDFLLKNVLPSSMPRSFAIQPTNYFEKVPESQRDHYYNKSYRIVPCHNETVPAKNMNDYMFQTETLLTALGLNIYDGAMWAIALSLLGEQSVAEKYYKGTIVVHKTVQFPDIRGDATCKGIMEYGQCEDPNQAGVCGFCYGDSPGNAAKTLTIDNAYFFRLISDYWSIEGTVDARCPKLKMEWTWNDYKPILGENSWCQLVGPANMAMIAAKNDASQIADSDTLFTLGIPFLSALDKMKVGSTGAFFYTPYNTWFGFNKVAQNIGSTFSIENQGSLLAGLEAMQYILKAKGPSSAHASYLPQINTYVADIKKIMAKAWNGEFFRQGGTYDAKTGSITQWGQNDEPSFAVDCQTWVSSVLGTKWIDSQFGPRTAFKLWQTTKKYANWTCPGGGLCGVGYTFSNISGQVFSGEWTYGAINWLRIMVADSGYDKADIESLNTDINNMLFGLESYLVGTTPINNSSESYDSVKYADSRYYIPFGWWANPLPATSSTAWAVAVASNYNPFNVDGGKYTRSYD